MRDQRRQLLLRPQGRNPRKIRLERREAALVDRVRIHATRVVVADLLFVGVGGGVRGSRFFHQPMQRRGVELEKIDALVELRHIGWDRMQLREVPAGVLVEVHAGVG